MTDTQTPPVDPGPSPEASAPTEPFLLRALKSLGSTLLALAVALVVVEVALRVLGLGPPERGPNNALPLRVDVPPAKAPLLVNALKPNASGQVLYPGHGDVPDRTVDYTINRDGFRDRAQSYAIPKPEGVFRIACLGDSVTYGTGVDLGATLPKQLEQLLAETEAARGCRVEVMNCGIYAHNTSQEVAWYEFNVARFEPDLVLVVANLNDASGRNLPDIEREETDGTRWIRRLGLTSGVWGEDETHPDGRVERTMALRRASRLVDLIAHRLYLRLRHATERESLLLDWKPGSPGTAMVETALARLAELARVDGFEARVAMYPNLESLGAAYPYAPATDSLRAICERQGLPFSDLLEPLVGQDAYALRAHPHDHHPNPRSHRIVAEWLIDWLEPSIACGG